MYQAIPFFITHSQYSLVLYNLSYTADPESAKSGFFLAFFFRQESNVAMSFCLFLQQRVLETAPRQPRWAMALALTSSSASCADSSASP